MIDATWLNEPELEFGSGRHVDVRFGIMNRSAFARGKADAPESINLGVVGTSQSIEGILKWLGRCSEGIDAKHSKQPHLFPRFPGFGRESCFGCSIVTDSRWQRAISGNHFDSLQAVSSLDAAVELATTLFMEEIVWLKDNTPASVIICSLPSKLLDAMDEIAAPPIAEDGDDVPDVASSRLDFRHLLKARAMPVGRAIQLVLPTTYGEKRAKPRTSNPNRAQRVLQDEATRAWNFHTALYYKAGGTPWRLVRDTGAYETCYIGLSFYRNLDAATVASSLAQVFNERGDGIVVRGGEARLDKDDRTPHLTGEQMQAVITRALQLYRKEHKHLPARLVVHKSSWFDEQERSGCLAAINNLDVELADLLSVSRSPTRLFRVGVYPPLRGTFASLDNRHHLLYTRGSVEFFETYPGMYVPRPLKLRWEYGDQTPEFLAREVLALTKMNWNNTQFDNAMPITLAAARQVGNVVKYVPADKEISPHYRFYM